jgi:hypothetical protein
VTVDAIVVASLTNTMAECTMVAALGWVGVGGRGALDFV